MHVATGHQSRVPAQGSGKVSNCFLWCFLNKQPQQWGWTDGPRGEHAASVAWFHMGPPDSKSKHEQSREAATQRRGGDHTPNGKTNTSINSRPTSNNARRGSKSKDMMKNRINQVARCDDGSQTFNLLLLLSYLLQPLGVILHDVLQLLDLLAREVGLRRRGVPLKGVDALLGAPARPALATGASSSRLSFGQDEGVGALAVLDLVVAPVAVVTAAATSSSTCAAAAAALRPPPLLSSAAARNHQQRREREPAVAEVAPQHRSGRVPVQFPFDLKEGGSDDSR